MIFNYFPLDTQVRNAFLLIKSAKPAKVSLYGFVFGSFAKRKWQINLSHINNRKKYHTLKSIQNNDDRDLLSSALTVFNILNKLTACKGKTQQYSAISGAVSHFVRRMT